MAKMQRKIDKVAYEKLAPDIKEMYEAGTDGAYFLSVDDAEALQASLVNARRERDELRSKFEGIDPEEVAALRAARDKDQRQRDLDEKNFDKILNEERTKLQGEVDLREKRIATLTTSLEDALIRSAAAMAIGANGNHKLLIPHVRNSMRLMDIDGKPRAVVMGEDGKPKLRKDAKTTDEYMTAEDLVQELRADPEFAGAWRGTGASGTKRVELSPGTIPLRKTHREAVQEAIAAGKVQIHTTLE